MLKSGHPQVGNRNEIADIAKATGYGPGLLQQSVHGFDVGIAAAIKHPTDHAVKMVL